MLSVKGKPLGLSGTLVVLSYIEKSVTNKTLHTSFFSNSWSASGVRLMSPAGCTPTRKNSFVGDRGACLGHVSCFGGDFELPSLGDPVSGGVSSQGAMENPAGKGASDTR